MVLTKFHIGQRVRVTKKICEYNLKDAVGTVSEVRMYYRIKFDPPVAGFGAILCEENELCEYVPEDIMEYLKHMLFKV